MSKISKILVWETIVLVSRLKCAIIQPIRIIPAVYSSIVYFVQRFKLFSSFRWFISYVLLHLIYQKLTQCNMAMNKRHGSVSTPSRKARHAPTTGNTDIRTCVSHMRLCRCDLSPIVLRVPFDMLDIEITRSLL